MVVSWEGFSSVSVEGMGWDQTTAARKYEVSRLVFPH